MLRLPVPTLLAGLLAATVLLSETPAHAAGPDGPVPPGPTVLDSGTVSITPLMAPATEGGTTIGDVSLGLLDDSSSDPAAQRPWYAPEDVVLHVGESSRQADGTWATAPQPEDGRLSTVVDLGVKSVGEPFSWPWDQINARFLDDVFGAGKPVLRLANATGPEGGSFLASSGSRTFFSSDALQAGEDQSRSIQIGVQRELQLAFTQPGRYCLTFAESVPTKSRGTIDVRATYTAYVGDLPAQVEACAPGEDWVGAQPVAPTVFDHGHTDLRAGMKDGQLVLGVGTELLPLSQAVFARTPPPTTVPPDSSLGDLSSIGAPGAPYWYFPATSTPENYLWPGFSTESVAPGDIVSPLSFTLHGYTVDGADQPDGTRIVLQDGWSGRASVTRPSFDSARGVTSFDAPANMHAHPVWAFTAEGRYCVNLSVRAQSASGTLMTAHGLLTFAVGDAAAATASQDPTCEQEHPDPASWPTLTGPGTGDLEQATTTVLDNTRSGILSIEDDGQSVALPVVTGTGAHAKEVTDADHLVVTSGPALQAGGFEVPWDWFQISTEHLTGDAVGLQLGQVRGPGTVTFHDSSRGVDLLGSAAGPETAQRAAPSRTTRAKWRFSAAGVYCVPLQVTGSSGATAGTTLTFAVGLEAPNAIVPCVDGQQPGDPGQGEEPAPDGWDVPHHSLTGSGAVVLNDGHVDLASVLEGDALLTKLKDTSTSSTPTWYQPEQVVLQLLPGSRSTVPEGSALGFLGAAGEPYWRVEQTQEPELLWPGWSTESVPSAATEGGVSWRLTGMRGPGDFALFQSTSFGAPEVLFNTRDGISDADSFEIGKNTHAHGTWAFGAEGTYCLAFERSATLVGGTRMSSTFTTAVAVGRTSVRDVDPRACAAATAPAPKETDTTPVPRDELTEANGGGLQVVGDHDGFAPGASVGLQVGPSRAGEWVSVWFDDTTWLGWAQVAASGTVQVRLPRSATAGEHVLVVEDHGGGLIGWDSLVVAREQPSGSGAGGSGGQDEPGVGAGGPGNPRPGDEDSPVVDATRGGATVDRLAATGLPASPYAVVLALLSTAAGLTLLVSGRSRRRS